jgi:cytosine/adenosine deaminase-related metal-dependent hydrolase
MPDHRLKIENAAFLLTLDGQRHIIRDGSLLVCGPRIERVGKAADLAAEPADRVIDAREMVVTPGFVNGHIHISYAHATRGIWPDDLGPQYLPNVFRLQAAMTPEEEHATSLLAITELLKGGTTTFLDPGSTKHLDACLDAYARAGCRIVVGEQVTDRPNTLNLPVYSTDEAVRRMEDTIARYDGDLDGRVRAWAMPFSQALASPDLLRAAKDLADRYGTGMTLHHSVSPRTVQESVEQLGRRPVGVLEDQRILGANLLLSHALGLDEGEVESLARTGTAVAVVPTAAIKAGNGLAASVPLPEMLARGVAVGLGTDAANNSNLVETLRAVYLAAVLFKDGRRDVKMVPAETALEMATIGGARALGLDAEVGSLEPGKRADLVLFDTRRAEWRTLWNPVNNLVYSVDGRSVHTVIVDGRVVVEGGRPTFVDEWELIQRVQAIGAAMLERTGTPVPIRWPMV